MSLTIAFDIDGTLSQLTEKTLEELGNPIEIEDITDYNDILSFFDGRYDTWRAFLRDKDIRREASTYPYMVDLWNRLRQDHRCIIITSTSRLPDQMAMLDWIYKNINTAGGVDIHFTNKKHQVEFDILIEDRVSNAVKAAKHGRVGVVVPRPWTVKETDVAMRKGIKRFFAIPSDEQAYNYLEEIITWVHRQGS